jgi:hypothetical protein
MVVAVLVAACSRGPAPGSSLTGAATPREAATAFLNAARAQDLQAMSAVWGTDKGPARDQLDLADHDRRLILMQSCYNHDRFQILDEGPGAGGRRMLRIQITRANLTRVPTFTMVRGPADRWYVQDADYDSVKELCGR